MTPDFLDLAASDVERLMADGFGGRVAVRAVLSRLSGLDGHGIDINYWSGRVVEAAIGADK